MVLPFEDLVEGQKIILQRLDEIDTRINKQPLKKYSPKDIADNTPLGIQTVWAAIKDGRIKAEKFGRKYLITAKEFNRVCEEAKSMKYQRVG
ncbi:hypothetical protein [Croceitalea rosinachiae]|uniref:Helix-turn-helix domain-containing protein n=1 Tax=Croceitalea rosinachiae TaxID=3075596 RepID=A0ABU3ADE5_9FLAO|nr:hypothetical protein [Croceitalea sp. F388]MDT0608009.1 hypothetical protein [Croceitalea sp. F388]